MGTMNNATETTATAEALSRDKGEIMFRVFMALSAKGMEVDEIRAEIAALTGYNVATVSKALDRAIVGR